MEIAYFQKYLTKIEIGFHLLQNTLLKTLCQTNANPCVILTDRTVRKLYGEQLSSLLSAEILELPEGESAKTIEVTTSLQKQLLQKGYGKDTVILALGGGAICDVAAFIASTYLRGLPLILLPTTLLAMVDAAIGGKTAINTSFGKNLVGSFYPPQAVIIDPTTLSSLPQNGWVDGLVEILKTGLVFDKELLSLATPKADLISMLTKAIHAKLQIVEQDPWDRGMRRMLNFGHTIGHALETSSAYEISHGQAVALGCIAESFLSTKLGLLPEMDVPVIQTLFANLCPTFALPKKYTSTALLQAMTFDKKRTEKRVCFVLLEKIGTASPFEGRYCQAVEPHLILETLDFLENSYG